MNLLTGTPPRLDPTISRSRADQLCSKEASSPPQFPSPSSGLEKRRQLEKSFTCLSPQQAWYFKKSDFPRYRLKDWELETIPLHPPLQDDYQVAETEDGKQEGRGTHMCSLD